MKEALRRVVCPTCSGPPDPEDSFFDEEKLRLENARLKDEVRIRNSLFHPTDDHSLSRVTGSA